jgi:hypothetical protein
MDKSRKHKESGLPQKYVGKLSDSTAKARKAHWKKMSKYSDRDPRAYEPAPGDAGAKTKPSRATREVRKMMNKEMVEQVEITEEAAKSLAAKAKKTGISLSTLKTVYRRGVAAWNSGHRPGTTAQQWGHARVNSYIRKGKGTYHGADKDLREQNMVHSVHVKGEDKSKKFQDHVKGWGGELHYVSDKGAAYKFKKPYQARGFTAGIKTGFRHLDAEHDGEVHEAKDPREYGYEGEMVMSQLKGVMNHAKQLHDMLEPNTDLPEWVQKKITLAYDYMQTAADYMATEMNEEKLPFKGPYKKVGPRKDEYGNVVKNVPKHLAKKAMKNLTKEEIEQIDELSKDTLKSYNKKSFNQYMNMTHGPTHWNDQPEKVRDKAAQRMRGQNMADRKLGKSVYKAKVPATEEAAVNSVGAGNVAGLQGDPPVHMKKKKKVMMTFKRYMRK